MAKKPAPTAPLTEEALHQRIAQLEQEKKESDEKLRIAASHIRFMRNTLTKLTGISTTILGE